MGLLDDLALGARSLTDDQAWADVKQRVSGLTIVTDDEPFSDEADGGDAGRNKFGESLRSVPRTSLTMIPVLWVGRVIAEADVIFETKNDAGRWEKDPDHPISFLMADPSVELSKTEMWMEMVDEFFIDGECHWEAILNGAGVPQHLEWIPEDTISALINYRHTRTAQVDRYFIDFATGFGQQSRIATSETILHFRYKRKRFQRYLGESPFAYNKLQIATDAEAEHYAAWGLHNNMGLTTVAYPAKDDRPLDPDIRDAAEIELRERSTGKKRGLPMVFRQPTDIQQLGIPPDELSSREMRMIPEERTSALAGAGPSVFNFGAGLDRMTYSNGAEQRRDGYESMVIPTQQMIAEQLGKFLLPKYGHDLLNNRVRFESEAVRGMQEDMRSKGEYWSMLWKSDLVKRRTAKMELGLDVDESEDGVYFTEATGVTNEDDAQTPGPDDASEERDEAQQDKDDAAAQAEEADEATQTANARLAQNLKSADHEPWQNNLRGQLNTEANAAQERMRVELVTAFKILSSKIAKQYESGWPEPSALTVAHRVTNTKAVERFIDPLDALNIDALLNSDLVDEWATDTLYPIYGKHYLGVYKSTYKMLDGLGLPALPREEGIGFAREFQFTERGSRRARLLGVADRDGVLKMIADGRREGYGADQLARMISDKIPAGRFRDPRTRALVIARTETMKAQNEAQLAVLDEMPNIQQVRAYDSQGPGLQRDEVCDERNGKVFTLDEARRELDREHPQGTLGYVPEIPIPEDVSPQLREVLELVRSE